MNLKKRHLAIYGGIKMQRMFCPKCKDMTLIIDDKLQCCGKTTPVQLQKNVEIMIDGVPRKRPSTKEQKRILEIQNNKCLYCEKPFGTMYTRKNKTYIKYTEICYDHLIPYSYCKENKNNFVASCNICNSIKHNKIFNTIEEAFHYIDYNRKKKGYFYADETEELSVV